MCMAPSSWTSRHGNTEPQAEGFCHLQLEPWLRRESATDAGSKDQHLNFSFKQVLWVEAAGNTVHLGAEVHSRDSLKATC